MFRFSHVAKLFSQSIVPGRVSKVCREERTSPSGKEMGTARGRFVSSSKAFLQGLGGGGEGSNSWRVSCNPVSGQCTHPAHPQPLLRELPVPTLPPSPTDPPNPRSLKAIP